MGVVREHRVTEEETKWSAVGKAETPEALTANELQEAVDEKDDKIEEYRQKCSEVWLLLVLPLIPSPTKPAFGQWRWPEFGAQWQVETGFDRVFVHEEDSSEPLHELSTRPRGGRRDARENSDIDLLLVVRNDAGHLKRPLRHLGHDLAATSYAVPSIMAYTEKEWEELERCRSPFRAAVETHGVSVL